MTVKALFVPIVGQILMRLTSLSTATFWFSYSVPPATQHRDERVRSLTATAHHCLGKEGGCWCFAGVVQGVYYDREGDEAVGHVPASVPVTSLWGPGDRSHKKVATKPSSLEKMVPHARTVVLPPDAGHAPGIERPDLLIAALKEQVDAVFGQQ